MEKKVYYFKGIAYILEDIITAVNDLDNHKYSDDEWKTKQHGNKYNFISPMENLYGPKRIFECLAKNKDLKITEEDFGSTENLRSIIEKAGFQVVDTQNSTGAIDFESIIDFGKNNFGAIYRKENTELKKFAQNAYEKFKNFSEVISNPNYTVRTNQWQNSGKITHYFWSELKNKNYQKFPFSISVFCNESFDFIITLELKTDQKNKATQEQINRFNELKQKNILGFEHINTKNRRFSKKLAEPYISARTDEIVDEARNIIKELEPFYESIFKDNNNQPAQEGKADMQDDKSPKQPLNQILYGPPGTGKTYNTVIKAMEIIDGKTYTDNKEISPQKYDYHDLKEQFDAYKEQGQIEFVTFHQSYSYEEFVEGIKPNINNADWETSTDELNYAGKDGIFKKICKNAKSELYKLKIKDTSKNITFEDIYNIFKEKYPEGSSVRNLLDISYKDDKNLIYHYGQQAQDRKINLENIKNLFENNKIYKTAIDFNADYKGNAPLKCYYFSFYKELLSLKKEKEMEEELELNNNQEYIIDNNANKYILIIDEINRGNISKIFGELITLIEEDKRLGNDNEMRITLPYSQQRDFGVPKNLYIIGTMNTSDRSIASIDIALRRRFKFVEMMPKPELFENVKIQEFDGKTLKDLLETLNQRISILLDRDHQIGHSYFIQFQNKTEISVNDLKDIWFDEIMPLLNEYFYGDWEKLQAILGEAKENDLSFIKKIKKVSFANKYTCDDEEKCDFNADCNFEEAMKNAFGELYKVEKTDTTQNEKEDKKEE